MNALDQHYPFALPELSYTYSALEPHIDAQTMEIHHSKHHAGYVAKLNAALESHPELHHASLKEVLTSFTTYPTDVQTAVKNNAGGHTNHSFFWQTLSPTKTEPSAKLSEKIVESFGSFETFTQLFSDTALSLFGSGWVWLVKTSGSKLTIYTTANQDSPISDNDTPILGLDVWEHAYYLSYQNRRADYLKAWWNIVDWNFVSRLIDQQQ
ncbi:superoxide dismutase [candidate division WWE3 bacterium CG_4_9_14_3_um_filter_41_6]|uniref:Superoxide dismutase n=1 Tax=candidate division WWE3 bacterium CG_4_10_14_0_2_um_filter_41_14 TaxID=1975072 RepID=A0A2M7TJR0_UNCKA|nr:MAG: superoxide dismutase [candidate division WWE3 bacterium CG_4_10_14_0_2_um_filter_41_14]PJA39418.1 MAG: superoxide dismutase [candidate division WWE3 bacterium CG_4_9_14_3_um_filter_41_6]